MVKSIAMIIFPLYTDWALFIFRLAMGFLVLAHGVPKLRNWKGTTDWFHSVGFKPGWLWGTMAGLLETFGGLALILGYRSRLFALFFVLQFAVILIWRLRRRDKFVGGWELDLLLFASAMVLLTAGGGAYTLGRATFWGY